MEEDMRVAETEQADTASRGESSSVDMSNSSPAKRGRGRPKGSKKLQVCVTDVNLVEVVSGISNGGSMPHRGRGRPKLSKDNLVENSVKTLKGQEGPSSGSKEQANNEEHTPRKRGRPKGSLNKSTLKKASVANGGADVPQKGRGRPKGSFKRKAESSEEEEDGPQKPHKRGRPRGSFKKTSRMKREVSSEGEASPDRRLNSPKRGRGRPRKEVNNAGVLKRDISNGISETPHRGRGRPRKILKYESQEELVRDGSQPAKRGRGRPKGSLNKKPPAYKMYSKVLQPRREQIQAKRGRPRKQPAKRGRPRKYPLPSPEELKKPKVWKPLGRPRKYPRVDPPEGALPVPRRSRGRPRKSESKKGAHLRKSWPPTPSAPRAPTDGAPRKRGRPPISAVGGDGTPRKRGRPKGSVNKNKARSDTQLGSTLANHSKANASSGAGAEHGGSAEEAAERGVDVAKDADQSASVVASNQAQ